LNLFADISPTGDNLERPTHHQKSLHFGASLDPIFPTPFWFCSLRTIILHDHHWFALSSSSSTGLLVFIPNSYSSVSLIGKFLQRFLSPQFASWKSSKSCTWRRSVKSSILMLPNFLAWIYAVLWNRIHEFKIVQIHQLRKFIMVRFYNESTKIWEFMS